MQLCKSRQLKVKSGNYSQEPDLTLLELKVLEVHNIQYEDNQDNNYHHYNPSDNNSTNLEQKPVIMDHQDTNDFNEGLHSELNFKKSPFSKVQNQIF